MTDQSGVPTENSDLERIAMNIVIEDYGGFKPFNLSQKATYTKIFNALVLARAQAIADVVGSEEVRKLLDAINDLDFSHERVQLESVQLNLDEALAAFRKKFSPK